MLCNISCIFIVFILSRLGEVDGFTKLLIDQDAGADDAMAVFVALLYEKYFGGPQIVALTTTHGNVPESQAFENTQKVLSVAQRRNVPVYRGASSGLILTKTSDHYFGIDGLGDIKKFPYLPLKEQPKHAVLALIEMSKKFEGELAVITLGTLTNIALAIKLDPLFIDRLAHLYIAAGHIYSEKYSKPEFNADMDVEAYHIVTQNAKPDKVTVFPFSAVMDSFNISMKWRKNVLGKIPTPIMKTQNMFERVSNKGVETWTHLDPIAMTMVLNSDIIEETKYSNNSIVLCGKKRGTNTNEFGEIDQANVKMVTAGNKEMFKSFIYKIFLAQRFPLVKKPRS